MRPVWIKRDMNIESHLQIERIIECVDCGGDAHLLTALLREDLAPGDVLVYRCAECLDRWDIVYDPGNELL